MMDLVLKNSSILLYLNVNVKKNPSCAGVQADGEVERPHRETDLQDVSWNPHLPRQFVCTKK